MKVTLNQSPNQLLPLSKSVYFTQLKKNEIKIQIYILKRFCFSGKKPLPFDNRSVIKGKSINSGESHGVLMWWVCNMDWENEILMSCAPKWANHVSDADEIPVN